MKLLTCLAMDWVLRSNITTNLNRVNFWDDSDKISLEGQQIDYMTIVVPIKSLMKSANGSEYAISKTILKELSNALTLSKTYPYTGEKFCNAFLDLGCGPNNLIV
jgi:hypothetical protein